MVKSQGKLDAINLCILQSGCLSQIRKICDKWHNHIKSKRLVEDSGHCEFVERGVVCFGKLLLELNKKKSVTRSYLFYRNEKSVSVVCYLPRGGSSRNEK